MAQAIQERKATNGAGATTALAVLKRDTVDVVAGRINELMRSGELHLPADYSVQNALKSAWLILQEVKDKDGRPALQVCTRDSIANALLDMAVQGLNPAKRQCYFIAYGQTLVCQRSYFGDMALVKRILPRAEIWFNVVYEGDEFEYQFERGRRVITKHNQRIENVKPDKIVAAYCVIDPGDGRPAHTEIMTWAQILQSWRQSRQYKPDGSTPHNTFPDQMALRTVIRRACKAVINSSSDDYLLLHHMHRSDELAAEAEAAEYANGSVIEVEPETVDESPPVDEPIAVEPEQEPALQPEPAAAQATLLDGPGF